MLEAQLGVDIPTREEMQRLEVSGRLYKEDDAVVMTATLPARTDSDDLLMAPVAFVHRRRQAHHGPVPRAARVQDVSAARGAVESRLRERRDGARRAARSHRRSA